MPDFTALVLGDMHLRTRTPPSRITFISDFEAKWAEVCQICNARNVTAVFILGDIFNSLQGNVSHGLVSWVIHQFRKCLPSIYVISGNHDVRLDSDREHLSRRPLGVVIESEVVKLLTPKPQFYMGKYLAGSDAPMSIDRSIDNYLMKGMPKVPKHGSIMCTHGNLLLPNTKCWSSIYHSVESLLDLNPIQQVHLNGHLHNQQGIFEHNSRLFVSPGSFMRDYDSNGILMDIKPKVALITWPEGGSPSAELITLLSAKPFKDVFRTEELQREKERGSDMAEFVQMVKEEAGKFSLSDDLLESVGKLDLPPKLSEKLNQYLTLAAS